MAERIVVSVDDLDAAVRDMLKDLAKETEKAVITAIDQYVEHDLIPELIRTSPRRRGNAKRYAYGWTSKKDGLTRIVYNYAKPRITHLLENGHVDFSTGKHVGKRPHIRKAYDETVDRLEERILGAIGQ